jgi:hypothetical protein
MSASLIGRLGSSAFRLPIDTVSMSLTCRVPAFLQYIAGKGRTDSAFEPSLYQRQSPPSGTQFSRAETKTPKRPLQFNRHSAETKCVHESPPVRGFSH